MHMSEQRMIEDELKSKCGLFPEPLRILLISQMINCKISNAHKVMKELHLLETTSYEVQMWGTWVLLFLHFQGGDTRLLPVWSLVMGTTILDLLSMQILQKRVNSGFMTMKKNQKHPTYFNNTIFKTRMHWKYWIHAFINFGFFLEL